MRKKLRTGKADTAAETLKEKKHKDKLRAQTKKKGAPKPIDAAVSARAHSQFAEANQDENAGGDALNAGTQAVENVLYSAKVKTLDKKSDGYGKKLHKKKHMEEVKAEGKVRIICRRHLPQCERKTAASVCKGGNEHDGNCLYALERMSIAALAQPKLNNEGFSEQSIPSGDIVGSLCGSTNQRSTVTCEGDFPFPFQVPMINYIWKEGTGTSMQEIEFYCRKCRKTMKMSYALTGDKTTPVLTGMTIRCHTNKCTRVVMLKKYTEGQIIAQADAQGRCYL